MASEKLLDLLNKSIAREIGVSIQYMWHHVMVKGIQSAAIGDVFKEIAIVEMKHAEDIAERLDYLGGIPTTKPTPIEMVENGDLTKMLEVDLKAEREAIELYKQAIKTADEDGDVVTRRLFEKILEDEEDHDNTFSTLLEKS